MHELEKGTLLLIDGEVWTVVGDYTEVKTPIDYELELVSNTDVWESFRESTIRKNVQRGSWQFIKV